jgi:acetate kinase
LGGRKLDREANARGGPLISPPRSPASVFVIPTDENPMIARHTQQLLERGGT